MCVDTAILTEAAAHQHGLRRGPVLGGVEARGRRGSGLWGGTSVSTAVIAALLQLNGTAARSPAVVSGFLEYGRCWDTGKRSTY